MTSDRRRASCVLAAAALLGATLATSRVTYAAPADPPASSEHETALKSGLEQYASGNFVTAIATWESLLATIGEERGYKVLYNLGLAYQQIGDVTHAIERYRAFVRQVAERPADPDLQARAEDAARRVSELESSHGAVFVKAPSRGGVVLTRVGTAEPRAAGYVVWLAPGAHTVEVFVGTSRAKTVRVEVLRGATVEVDTSPPEEDAPLRAQAPLDATRSAQAPDTSARTTWLVAGAGVTVASFALPLAMFFVADGKRDDAEALGAGHTEYAANARSYDSARTAYAVSYALPAILGATTAIVWLTWKTHPEPASARAAAIGASLGPGGGVVHGRF